MIAAAKIALDDCPWTASVGGNRLAATPRLIYIVILMEIVHQVSTFENHNLKVSMSTRTKVALNDSCHARCIGRNDLPTPPWRWHVAIIVKVMDQVPALGHDYFKISVAPIAKVALYDAARSRCAMGNDLAADPRVVYVAVIMPVMHQDRKSGVEGRSAG